MEYNKINLMFPTYKRVKIGKMPRLVNSCIEYADNIDNICMTILVNHDDHETLDWLAKRKIPCEHHIITTYLVRPHLARYFNHMYNATRFKSDSCLVSMMGDDMHWETKGYDTRILDIANKTNGIGIYYCFDKFSWGNLLCVNLFVSEKFVRATGRPFMCPLFAVDYIDVVWMRVGQLTNTLYLLSDVILKHDHASGKSEAEWDDTFNRLRAHWPGAQKHMGIIADYADEIVAKLKESGILNDVCGRVDTK